MPSATYLIRMSVTYKDDGRRELFTKEMPILM
jgi:hypothetical protein